MCWKFQHRLKKCVGFPGGRGIGGIRCGSRYVGKQGENYESLRLLVVELIVELIVKNICFEKNICLMFVLILSMDTFIMFVLGGVHYDDI